MTHTFAVTVRRKPGLSDPEGATTRRALNDLGFQGVSHVSFGKVITVTIEAESAVVALSDVEKMCAKLLANPVIETFSIEVMA